MIRLILPALLVSLPMSLSLPQHSADVAEPTGMVRPMPMHLALVRSSPAADSTVHAPTAVQLWFSEAPQAGATTIRVQDAAGKLVATGDVVSDDATPKAFKVAFSKALAGGKHVVSWRAMGSDGHVVKGDFSFNVMAHDDATR